MGQMLAPGVHRLRFIASYRTFFSRLYVETWTCRGCLLTITVRGKQVDVVTDVLDTFKDEHTGFVGIRDVMDRIKAAGDRCKAGHMKMRVELVDWRMIKANYGKRVIKK